MTRSAADEDDALRQPRTFRRSKFSEIAQDLRSECRYYMAVSDSGLGEIIQRFCSQARARSDEHRAAMATAHVEGWRSIEVSILRMELDSLVRVVYLNHHCDLMRRVELLTRATTPGIKFGVHDSDMVDFTEGLTWLTGWPRRVYDYSNAFIHLSSQHDYGVHDPFQRLDNDERTAITSYLREYHGGTIAANSTFEEVVDYVPKVFDKIARNLEIELSGLERDGALRATTPRTRSGASGQSNA